MTAREALAWLLVGFLCGLLVGMMLAAANRPPAPQQPPTDGTPPRRGKTQPIRIVEKPVDEAAS